jgi:hypothetical protein
MRRDSGSVGFCAPVHRVLDRFSARRRTCVAYSGRENSRREYVYEGRIRRLGLDLGVTSGAVLSWAVLARNSRIGPGTLRGNYVGLSGNIAFGPGFGANALIGGSRRTIILQPLSTERSVGLNFAASVTNLTLGSSPAR